MSLAEIRRFRADAIKHKVLMEHVQELTWEEVVDLANSHGYAFSLEESQQYFQEIQRVFLKPSGMTKTEIFVWEATGNPNALVEEKMPETGE